MHSSNAEIDYYYIVAAAGVGKRMELDYPKQFLEVEGKPIFIKTLEVIEKNNRVTGIVVVTNKEYISEVKKMCRTFEITKVIDVVSGGKERQDSIYNALKQIPKESIIGVQDGVRPFIEDRYIEESYAKLMKETDLDGVVVGVPIKDTIKVVNSKGEIVETPKRDQLFAAQTPQVFRGEILHRSYKTARKQKFLGTDDSSLVEKAGGRVGVLAGSYENIKITTPEDLLVFSKEKIKR
ncbi:MULTISPECIES: 2-C-methyl-D-erythritol 4-phosphate cytidylyltransferase [Psychrilyobacter]|uniref:2-C-methyl-D-erythritol 4-phosphate cytidylyltransferase n=1 Tax=Psychrilyobacter piezotolerans TaxID=2293438 RepID=A0ABX9KEG3_9FUSO|nr:MULTISPECIES: 2-C-methyl-D-erythritol 4-phosphate cytidylyltransferase [Psychrilyobacter]MCS5420831.1 2-C-methyl-D-erythritol 4-phosphate cytidylyltransferase [Psychrilyobacter sp. S5]NDI79125.1 2-C-methyl-D-erythritol 4-phosphate cytidylyltransferase [Psychrilyobacter piezotolerans]RDE59767.1 2-C-methyl-D-erythritol 4-phosphate cytidylyltransferase [Psychrilyobacter sp. S5]REI40093.1 2-C-methyl-D-erythritol 4-phosphate cytidylyltransferase [Psychrilyobacter piezotolerans]